MGPHTASDAGRAIQVQRLGHARECRSLEAPKKADATMSKLGAAGHDSWGSDVNI